MEIRKTFKFEMAHIVRNAWSRRCSHNIHGHSYVVEIYLESQDPVNFANGGMVIDFGLVKKVGNDFIDSFDHSLCLWDLPEESGLISKLKNEFERFIVTPFPTTAEVQAAMFFAYFHNVLNILKVQDSSFRGVNVSRVIVHETTTGKAEYNREDFLKNIVYIDLPSISFSEGIKQDWKEKAITEKALKGEV